MNDEMVRKTLLLVSIVCFTAAIALGTFLVVGQDSSPSLSQPVDVQEAEPIQETQQPQPQPQQQAENNSQSQNENENNNSGNGTNVDDKVLKEVNGNVRVIDKNFDGNSVTITVETDRPTRVSLVDFDEDRGWRTQSYTVGKGRTNISMEQKYNDKYVGVGAGGEGVIIKSDEGIFDEIFDISPTWITVRNNGIVALLVLILAIFIRVKERDLKGDNRKAVLEAPPPDFDKIEESPEGEGGNDD